MPQHAAIAPVQATKAAARNLTIDLRLVEVKEADEFDRAFAAMAADRADALLVLPSTLLFNERKRVVDLATKHRLPLTSQAREFAELGGLMAYGANIADLFRRSATYMDKILKGANPSDLPVEQPTKFELVINLKTAKTLGLTISDSFLLLADEVIE
jgi:putative ABC transport system substrate-binding protein